METFRVPNVYEVPAYLTHMTLNINKHLMWHVLHIWALDINLVLIYPPAGDTQL